MVRSVGAGCQPTLDMGGRWLRRACRVKPDDTALWASPLPNPRAIGHSPMAFVGTRANGAQASLLPLQAGEGAKGRKVNDQSFSFPMIFPVAGSIFSSTSLPDGSSASAFQMPSS